MIESIKIKLATGKEIELTAEEMRELFRELRQFYRAEKETTPRSIDSFPIRWPETLLKEVAGNDQFKLPVTVQMADK